MVGRTFALVELVRSEADFIMAPVLLQVAEVASGGSTPSRVGIIYAIWVTTVIAIAATIFMLAFARVIFTQRRRFGAPKFARMA